MAKKVVKPVYPPVLPKPDIMYAKNCIHGGKQMAIELLLECDAKSTKSKIIGCHTQTTCEHYVQK